jgi:two-component system, cell cycle response regulator DivK
MGQREQLYLYLAAGKDLRMKATILVIEDNEKNRYLTTFILEKSGYRVVEACDGQADIALARQVKPALILLDIQLPIMDGYAVARELRQNRELGDVPINAVTSYAMVGDREQVLAAGCAGYIEKPINPMTFVAEIEQFLPAQTRNGAQEVHGD